MKLLNKILTLIFYLIIGIISLITLLMTLGWTTPLQYLNEVFNAFNTRWIIGVTAALVLIGALYLLVSAFLRDPVFNVKITSNETGEISITMPAVEALVKKAAFQIKGVKEVKPLIKHTGDGIALFLKVSMQPGTIIPQSAEELQTLVKEYLDQVAGLSVAEIKVLITHVSQESKSRVD
ncbi:alkaline shock response membrane anchor protein AmaP [Dehalobacterium formicoaceticum]|uniref:Alkaline shock response membrane anchor protein AmaP n=1 Tax=Dehalobacterium formicoaceticum TaxID=51515 RepID=A0ABT1Y662_9FIRM|nr:alkaline shock response membrane anchor protein AmaP [Dehalobacterium formicoaceticum]MCR6545956.1 alkaline shock response membrane anchor protein AmaP [Dehalobacterium formicoaceticum]